MNAADIFQATYSTPQPVRGSTPYSPSYSGLGATENADETAQVTNSGVPQLQSLKNIVGTRFLNEPFYRWVVFLLALGFVFGTWNALVSYMK